MKECNDANFPLHISGHYIANRMTCTKAFKLLNNHNESNDLYRCKEQHLLLRNIQHTIQHLEKHKN